MKHPFTREIRIKGWSLKALAKHWGVSIREMSNIAENPSQKELDAIRNGLPNKRQEVE